MGLSAADKREIVIRYVREFGYRAIQVIKGAGVPFFTITQMLTCEDWEPDHEALTKVISFLEGKKNRTDKSGSCCGKGCDVLRACTIEKDHLIRSLEENIALLKEKVRKYEG